MRDSQVEMLQKMLLLRLMQIIERRDRLQAHRHVTVLHRRTKVLFNPSCARCSINST